MYRYSYLIFASYERIVARAHDSSVAPLPLISARDRSHRKSRFISRTSSWSAGPHLRWTEINENVKRFIRNCREEAAISERRALRRFASRSRLAFSIARPDRSRLEADRMARELHARRDSRVGFIRSGFGSTIPAAERRLFSSEKKRER